MTYKLVWVLCFIYYRVFFRTSVRGAENIPVDGAVVLCANHSSNHDPLVLGSSVKRPVHYLAKKELFKNPVFAYILRKIHAIPVNRGTADLTSFKNVLEQLEKGGVVGIFAQGHRSGTIDANDAKAGAALYAVKSGAALVPVRIDAGKGYRLFGRVSVRIGKPIDMEPYKGKKIRTETLKELTGAVMDAIINL